MNGLFSSRRAALASLLLACASAWLLAGGKGGGGPAAHLTADDVSGIVDAALAQAAVEKSLLRVDAGGNAQTTRMHIAVVARDGRLLALHSMDDAWVGSIDIAKAKAYTASAFSSD